MDAQRNKIGISHFFETPVFKCSYLSGHLARSRVAMPSVHLNRINFGELLRLGYRRSGFFIYQPICNNCRACIPVRISVNEFEFKRRHNRLWNNYYGQLRAEKNLKSSAEAFNLYQQYQQLRHPGGGMDQDRPEHFNQFFLETLVESVIYEFRDNKGNLRLVTLTDYSDDGASAVYNFYDPNWSGLGNYAILWQIKKVQEKALPYLYLGYWIANCKKMNYKKYYQPLEFYKNNKWNKWAI